MFFSLQQFTTVFCWHICSLKKPCKQRTACKLGLLYTPFQNAQVWNFLIVNLFYFNSNMCLNSIIDHGTLKWRVDWGHSFNTNGLYLRSKVLKFQTWNRKTTTRTWHTVKLFCDIQRVDIVYSCFLHLFIMKYDLERPYVLF